MSYGNSKSFLYILSKSKRKDKRYSIADNKERGVSQCETLYSQSFPITVIHFG